MTIQEAMNDALSEVREALLRGTDPDLAIANAARSNGVKPDALRVRAKKLLEEPSLLKFQDPEYRIASERKKKISYAKNAAKWAEISGQEKSFDEIIHEKLGEEFSNTEKNEISLEYLMSEISETRK